ncbi:putative cytochrome P450 [Septoria linicola]|nr:putative cytochrome P450 [Septoria linicola]
MSLSKVQLSEGQLEHHRIWKYVILALVGLFAAKFVQRLRFRSKYKLPGLEPGLPFVGNALQIPRGMKERLQYLSDLRDKHGEMFTLDIGGTRWIFLNSQRVVTDLLDKRAAIYSSRRPTPMSHLATRGRRLLMMPYGDLWRRERKVMHQILNQTQQQIFAPWQDLESKALLYNYLANSDEWYKAHAAFSGSVVLAVVFGRRATPDDQDLRASLQATDEYLAMLGPGSSVADIFPFLTQMPYFTKLQPWRWHADELCERTAAIYKKEVEGVKERMRLGVQKPCFMTEFLESKADRAFTEEEVLFIAGILLEAGTDTTRMSLNQIVAAATLWPEWAATARKHLDRVCGSEAERLPSAEDVEQLPYIKAVVKESFRWKPSIAEIGSPHSLTRDDEYEGYKFPAGSIFMSNAWLIANDPNEYDQPDRFWPERLLNEDMDKRLSGHVGFGAGRRVCVGYNVGTTNMHIAVARLLYCFDFVSTGQIDMSKPLSIDPEHPPCEVKVTVRSDAHRRLIERECRDAAFEAETGS